MRAPSPSPTLPSTTCATPSCCARCATPSATAANRCCGTTTTAAGCVCCSCYPTSPCKTPGDALFSLCADLLVPPPTLSQAALPPLLSAFGPPPCSPSASHSQVRDEIINNIEATYKETDLFKMFQTGDLANMDALDKDSAAKLPTVLRLRDALYAPEFRAFISEITGAWVLLGAVGWGWVGRLMLLDHSSCSFGAVLVAHVCGQLRGGWHVASMRQACRRLHVHPHPPAHLLTLLQAAASCPTRPTAPATCTRRGATCCATTM